MTSESIASSGIVQRMTQAIRTVVSPESAPERLSAASVQVRSATLPSQAGTPVEEAEKGRIVSARI